MMRRENKTDRVKLGAKELREYEPTKEDIGSIKRNEIYIIVDNVLDTFNTGSIFRLADAVAAKKVFLVGETDGPDDVKVGHRIQKASVGTYRWVPWGYVGTVGEAIKKLKRAQRAGPLQIIAIEQSERSVDYRRVRIEMPVALIVGHETRGVSKEGLELADQIVELPLFGVNRSLNVLVALSIIAYRILE